MSRESIAINNIAEKIIEAMKNYSEDVTDGLKKSIDIVAKETNEIIKKNVAFKQPSGDYVKNFSVKKVHEDKYSKRKVWHVTGGQYRLTHLLEKGHVTRNGGRTKAYKHIIFGEEYAKEKLERLAREVIENA
jgi:hypothetical protein